MTGLDEAVALLTLAEAKELIGDRADSSLVEVLVNSVSVDLASIAGMPNRNFLLQTFDEYQDGKGTRQMVLQNYPVKTLTSLHVGEGSGATLLVEGNDKDFVLNKKSGVIRLVGMAFPRGVYNVRAQYTAGIDGVAAVPHDLKMAAKEAVAFRYKVKDRMGVAAISTPDQVTTYITSAYPASVVDVAKRYARHMVA